MFEEPLPVRGPSWAQNRSLGSESPADPLQGGMAMAIATIAAVQAAYILMDQQACLDKAIALLRQAADGGAKIVVFPEAFIPGTPIWIDSRPI